MAKALAQRAAQPLRILSADFDQQSGPVPDALLMAAVLFLWLIIFGEAAYDLLSHLAQSGWLVSAIGLILIVAVYVVHVVDVSSAIATLIRTYSGDPKPLLDDINDGLPGGPVAIFTRNPAALSDNPLTVGLQYPLLGLEPDVAGVGIFHDKYQIITRQGGEAADGQVDGNVSVSHVGYAGGMDIKPNRMTTWCHQSDPMHDVHARLRGPIVGDLAQTFADYWDYAVHHEPSARVPHSPRQRVPAPMQTVAITTPLDPPPRVIPAEEDPHIARLVRTVHRSAPGSTATQLPFATEGDDSAARSVMTAIAAAEDYIYIEDQYFTPPRPYTDLLVAAAARCRRLIVVVPTKTDQAFGAEKRDGIYARLRAAWGDRFVVGTPERRPQTVSATRLTHAGRVNLLGAVSAGDHQIFVGPQARVPGDAPFWIWIAGEQMLVSRVQKGVEVQVNGVSVPAALLDVVRGGALGLPGWGAHTRAHAAGAAATLADVSGIYNHAKTMMVDDLFVSIGSTNVNRRGFYHDGEIGVVAVPQALRGSPSNPARWLRTRLWAEHLGIPPGMGPALLRDPIAASDLFFRSRWAGNRFAPASAGDVRPYVPYDATIFPLTAINILKAIVALPELAVNVAYQRMFNVAFDPTSYLQPEPDRELV
jgi:phosphatidylserine/phosphatidylglycerophosphate/cardiolipin synthase-like enzyme